MLADYQAIVDEAKAEERGLTDHEQRLIDAITADVEAIYQQTSGDMGWR